MTRKTSPLPNEASSNQHPGALEALRVKPLTPKEKAVLEFIEEQMMGSGVCPSYQEIKDHFGLASFNSVQNYLKQLTNKGYVETSPHQKRSLRLLHSSRALQDELARRAPSLAPTPGPSRGPLLQARGEALSLPLMGRVAAGRPIERLTHEEFVEVPPVMVKKPDSTFLLQVEGDSMIDDGIWDGDLILVQSQSFAQNGDIIVATVDQEATVKRFYLRNAPQGHFDEMMVELRPSNPRLKSMWYSPHEVEIRGLVVGLIRKY